MQVIDKRECCVEQPSRKAGVLPYIVRSGLGQDGHQFLSEDIDKPCVIGGVIFPNTPGFDADSDGDIVLHAICNALSSLTGCPILAKLAVDMCHKQNIKDSRQYVELGLAALGAQRITNVSLAIEGKRPKIYPKVGELKLSVSEILDISPDEVGITATTGNYLSYCAEGRGAQCFCIVTTMQKNESY